MTGPHLELSHEGRPLKKYGFKQALIGTGRVFKNMTPRHWGWLHFKLALFYWANVMYRWTPNAVADSLREPLLLIWTLLTCIGAVVSIVGLVMSAQPANNRFHVIGVSIELSGLCLFIIGPFVYWTTQLSILLTRSDGAPNMVTEMHTRYAICCFAYAMMAAIVARILVVLPRFRQYSRRSTVHKTMGRR